MKLKHLTFTLAIAMVAMVSACEKGELSTTKSGNLVPLTVDQDPTLPSIQVNGTQLHAEAFGPPDSMLVIVLHGGPGADYRYLLNCRDLAADGYRVVFYDQRGSGLSKRHPQDSYTLEVMYDDLTAVIAHYRTSPSQKVVLLGHSWGAMLATAYINTYPDRIDGVILGEPGGFTNKDVLGYISRIHGFGFFSEALNDAVYFDQFITGKLDEHEVLDYKFELWAAADETEASPTGNEGPLPAWRSGAAVFNAFQQYLNETEFDWTTNLQQFSTRVLFTYSENNSGYGEAYAKKVSSAYPNVQLFRTDDSGHDMLSFPTGWQNFHPIALNYLNEIK